MQENYKESLDNLLQLINTIEKDDLHKITNSLEKIEANNFSLDYLRNHIDELQSNTEQFVRHSILTVDKIKTLITDIAND
jgi:flagellar motor component MotA